MSNKYPNKFVVKRKNYHTWDVTYNPTSGLYDWVSTTSGPVGSYDEYTVSGFESSKETFQFIFPEPELVFPFTVKHSSGSPHSTYVITKGSTADSVNCYNITYKSTSYNLWSFNQCKQFIKDGIWLVQSVGEQKPVEAPPSPSKTIGEYALKVDTKEALEAVKELTEALEKLEVVYKRVQVLFGGDFVSVDSNCTPINFEDF